jgi:hypothetical protein
MVQQDWTAGYDRQRGATYLLMRGRRLIEPCGTTEIAW